MIMLIVNTAARVKTHFAKKIFTLLLAVFALLLSVSAANTFAADDNTVSKIIAQNIQGTKVLDVQVLALPNDDGVKLIVTTSAGTKQFIMTRDNIVAALSLLQNPQAYGASNQISTHHKLVHLPTAQPAATALTKTQAIALNSTINPITAPPTSKIYSASATTLAPTATRPAIPTHNAPAIVTQTVMSSNQQASK